MDIESRTDSVSGRLKTSCISRQTIPTDLSFEDQERMLRFHARAMLDHLDNVPIKVSPHIVRCQCGGDMTLRPAYASPLKLFTTQGVFDLVVCDAVCSADNGHTIK